MDSKDHLHEDTARVLNELAVSDSFLGSESSVPVLLEKSVPVKRDQGALLRAYCLGINAKRTLEIGLAYGGSALWILDAQRFQVGAHHIAIDPFQRSQWGGVAISAIGSLTFPKSFELLEDLSIHALSGLIKKNDKFDLIFIDGNHRFDDVMVDFYLSDQLLNVGGILAFHDLWMPSISMVSKFVATNRAFRLVSEALDMHLYQKLTDDSRPWNHFNPFP